MTTKQRARRATIGRGRALALAMLFAAAAPAVQAGCQYKQLGVIPAAWDDHRLMIAGSVNNAPMKMAVDTGTPWTTLSHVVAMRLNVPLAAATAVWQGPGGETSGVEAKLKELSIGRFQWFDAFVIVSWQAEGGFDARVGANVLLQHDTEFDSQRIVFFAPTGCEDTSLGYWADDVPWLPTATVSASDLRTIVTLQVNGQPVRALIDSSSPTSMLDVATARRLGAAFDDAPPPAGPADGHAAAVSVARVDAIAIGPEVVRHARVQVGDLLRETSAKGAWAGQGSVEPPAMILGADFLQSHRVLFATSQHRLYFSYLGGEVFSAPPRH